MAHWAEDWTKVWTKGEGRFTMTAMEDAGYAAALTELDVMGKVDFQRVLDLRAASNYCMPPPGETAADSLEAGFVSYIPAVETMLTQSRQRANGSRYSGPLGRTRLREGRRQIAARLRDLIADSRLTPVLGRAR